MIKMIVTDLDDTLLRSDKTISEFSLETIAKCRENGLKFIYATARGASAEIIAPPALFDGRVTVNGANGFLGNERLYRSLIEVSDVRKVLIESAKRGLKSGVEDGIRHYANFNVNSLWDYIADYEITNFNNLEGEMEKAYILVNDNSDVEFIKNILPKGYHFTVSRDGMAQIMNGNATKTNGIIKLASQWGVDIDEVVAFGDDYNDLEMLKTCGIGVAMENAIEDVKKVADHICDTNEKDGLAKWILENVLK